MQDLDEAAAKARAEILVLRLLASANYSSSHHKMIVFFNDCVVDTTRLENVLFWLTLFQTWQSGIWENKVNRTISDTVPFSKVTFVEGEMLQPNLKAGK